VIQLSKQDALQTGREGEALYALSTSNSPQEGLARQADSTNASRRRGDLINTEQRGWSCVARGLCLQSRRPTTPRQLSQFPGLCSLVLPLRQSGGVLFMAGAGLERP
jgi:hypothetical protein